MELVVTGYVGDSGSRLIYTDKESRKKLLDRYPKSFFGVLEEELSEAEPPALSPDVAPDFEDSADGGVFGAMWRILKRNRLGAEFSQRAIPVRQQTIEICEMFSIDPYRLESKGCRVWLVSDMGRFLKEYPDAVTIGHTEKGPAIKRTDGETLAYLRKS
ncbi:MAG: hypothetical protein MJ059_00260 [Lachnospiraceae bacterium]|nr:hypothetical protein [Lachnospiraceae bacterium]